MQIILDIDDGVSEDKVPMILTRLADDYLVDRASGDEGGTLHAEEGTFADSVGDWAYYAEKVVDL